MNHTKPKLALALGILCISIFPILVRLHLTDGLISAFYRMFIAAVFLLPYVFISKRFQLPECRYLLLSAVCGMIFASDISVWNFAIQHSSATQATLLTNLTPVWVGMGSFFFLKNKPSANFWLGTIVALFGMLVLVGFDIFIQFKVDLAFVFAMISGMLYASYIIISKSVLEKMDVLSFMSIVLFSSSLVLAIVCWIAGECFSGFSTTAWLVLLVQGIVCQLIAWLLISYATQHLRATRVSLSLLSQAVLTTFLAWIFLGEMMSWDRIVGAVFLLLGIRITFYNKPLWIKK